MIRLGPTADVVFCTSIILFFPLGLRLLDDVTGAREEVNDGEGRGLFPPDDSEPDVYIFLIGVEYMRGL